MNGSRWYECQTICYNIHMDASHIKHELKALADSGKAALLQRYFKIGKGEYSEGDKFLGVVVPTQRKVAKKFEALELNELQKLLESGIHECRFTALEILVMKYESASIREKARIAAFYLKHKKYVNNWDLVDTSAPYILGDWLIDKDRSILFRLVKSKSVWDRRIAILSTFAFIKHDDFSDSLKLAKILMIDDHDLIHKACGWMLREVGKRSPETLERFLDKNCTVMPRTMLRYAIERMGVGKRKIYMFLKKD